MEITEDHVEYAVVERLRDMLNVPHEKYKVTAAYAYFTAVLCWTVQRMRTDTNRDASASAMAASKAWARLAGVSISSAPWGIQIDTPVDQKLDRPGSFGALASVEFKGRDVQELLIKIRNAVAHGDARNVKPLNHRGFLKGFEFVWKDVNDNFLGKLVLTGNDMVRIADELARLYCEALRRESKSQHLAEDTKHIREAA